jgi:adenylate kinase
MNIVHFGGAQGVGKTAVLKYLRESLSEGADVVVLSSSKELNNISTSEYGKTIKELNSVETRTIQELFMQNLRNSKNQNVLLDSHYVSISQGNIINLTPKEHAKEFNCHIVLEASPYTILTRRLNDDRTSRLLDLPTIVAEVYAEKNEALLLAQESGTRIYVVDAEGTIEKTADTIRSILRNEFEI